MPRSIDRVEVQRLATRLHSLLMLGDSNIALTMDTYSNVIPALHMAAAAKMRSLFASG